MDKEMTMYHYNDAKMDMLKGLNELTDKEHPSCECVKMMGILARAIKDIQEAENMCMASHYDDEAMVAKK